MNNSRKIDDLHPLVASRAQRLLDLAADSGIDLLVTSTYRDHESQDALYARGRTKPGPRVTNAAGGQSYHNFRVAFDVVPLRLGKPVWGTKGDDLVLWQHVGRLGELIGLEWAGRWKTMKEFPHFQYTGGHDLAWFQSGRHLA